MNAERRTILLGILLIAIPAAGFPLYLYEIITLDQLAIPWLVSWLAFTTHGAITAYTLTRKISEAYKNGEAYGNSENKK